MVCVKATLIRHSHPQDKDYDGDDDDGIDDNEGNRCE